MNALDALWHDAVFAARLLRKSPAFAAGVALTLALGVGVNTAVFSVVHAIFRPLPVREGDRLVTIATQDPSNRTLHGVSLADLEDYRAATHDVFDDIAAYSAGFLGLAPEGGRPERVLVTWVTGNYFPLLDVRPAEGRLIARDEGGPGRTDPVVVLGHSTWQRRFRGDRSVVGTIVRVNGRPCTIVGVAPPGFSGTFAFSDSELYLPLNWSGGADFDAREARGAHAIARLRPGVTQDRAQAAMSVVAERLARQHPASNANVRVRVVPERLARPEEDQFRSNALGAAIMLALAGLVMIVAAMNVVNLLLARAIGRQRELAIRVALGAGRGRLVAQMVTESLLNAALGGVAGVLAGTWAARLLEKMKLPGDLPVRFDFRPDIQVLAYAALVVVLTGVLVGLLPALRASSAGVDRMLRQSRHGSAIARRPRGRALLVVAQIALCLVLLVTATLFGRSLVEAERSDLGFRPDGVLNVHMDVGQLGYTPADGIALFDEIERRVRSIPGVEHVSFAFTVPMGYIRLADGVEAERQSNGTTGRVSAGRNAVGSEYFETMGIPVVRGRVFSDERRPSPPVAVVNHQLASTLWPGRDPVGQRFRPGGPSAPWIEVVGVVGTGKYRFLFENPYPFFYVPIAQEYSGLRVLHVRASVPPESLAPAVERTIRELAPDLPLYDVQSMTRALGGGPGFFPVRVGAAAAATLGILAFALALAGVYGVVSFLAGQRTHELGVRMALGASRHDVVRLVLGDGLNLVVCGLAAGLLMTLAWSRAIGSLLFGVSARDPLTLVSVAPLLGVAALIACAVPAWRAARIDPMAALRSE